MRTKMGIQSIILIILTFILSACATKSDIDYIKQNEINYAKANSSGTKFRDVKDIPQFKSRRWLIAPGYLFSISHPSDDKLKGRYRVSYDGILRLPYNVRIKAKGLTFEKLKTKVKNSYKKFFQKGANQVRLSLIRKEYFIEVRGFVKKPGRYLVTRKESIDKVINKAGGVNADLQKDFLSAEISQQGKNYSVSLNTFYENIKYSKSFTWTGADTIFVNTLNDDAYDESVPMVTVLSGVASPGKVKFKDTKDLFYYLSKSGGALASIKYDETYILRRTTQGLKRIQFDITVMSEIPAIQANDVIMLYSDHRTVWDKILQRTAQVAGIFSSLAIILLL